jgi:hypothetical protein
MGHFSDPPLGGAGVTQELHPQPLFVIVSCQNTFECDNILNGSLTPALEVYGLDPSSHREMEVMGLAQSHYVGGADLNLDILIESQPPPPITCCPHPNTGEQRKEAA